MNANPSNDIWAEVTPNPNTLKFNVQKVLLESGTVNYTDPSQAQGALLPEELFKIENVLGVMVGRGFITITRRPGADWQTIVPAATEKIKNLLDSDKMLVPQQAAAEAATRAGADGDVEARIREILDREIRPAVAMDGGDIVFYGYENGVVTLHLQGSCSSCPSSIMTLKMGVENRLKQSVPEVREVVQV